MNDEFTDSWYNQSVHKCINDAAASACNTSRRLTSHMKGPHALASNYSTPYLTQSTSGYSPQNCGVL